MLSLLYRNVRLLIVVLFAIICVFASGQNLVDSLQKELDITTEDTLKVNQLIRLWEATAYSDKDQAQKYADEALRLSLKSNYKRGLAESYQRIAVLFNNYDEPDSAEFYYNKSLALSREFHYEELEANILMDIGILYYSKGVYGKAMIYCEESRIKFSNINDEKGIAMILGLLGNINFYSGNFDEAQRYHLESVQFFEKSDDEVRYADALVYLASNYQALGKYDKGLQNLYKACLIYKKLNDQYYLAQAYNNIGFIHKAKGDVDSALIYFERTIDQSLLSDNLSSLNLAYMNMGVIYKKRKEFVQAYEYLNKSLQLALSLDDKIILSESYSSLGDLYSEEGYYTKALSNFKIALQLAQEVGSKDNVKSIYKNFSDTYARMNDHKKALEYYKLFTIVKDSMYNENIVRKTEEMEARYEKEKKDKEIAIHKSQIDLLSKDLQVETIKRNILIIGFILSVLIGGFFVYALRLRMKGNKKIRDQEKKLEQEKLRVAELERDNTVRKLEYKKNELTTHALQIVQKNELLDTLKKQISTFEEKSDDNHHNFQQLRLTINGSAQTDKDWDNFNKHFETVHQGFYRKLKDSCGDLTGNDLRLSAMIRMNLNSKEVASIMHISPESVKKARYRLKKKLQLESETDLHGFIMKV